MRSPSQMQIIQIDITNACFNKCSNCSRFCGNHKQPFFMDWNTFRRACESLYDFPGMIGVMGGEPTLHPNFDRFIRFYSNCFRRGSKLTENVNEPIVDICAHRNSNWEFVKGRRRGLWTSFGPGYSKHFELIRDVFEYQCVNDHKHPGKHQASQVTYKELGISDEEFITLRDNCWLQNKWSASITPKGAFFCEVAGALDMLFDGPGGWPIEQGWWRREVKDFGSQLDWCKICGFCLPVPMGPSNTEADIVSPEWDKKLDEIGSKKKRVVIDLQKYDRTKHVVNQNAEPYLIGASNQQRANQDTTQCLALNKLVVVMVNIGYHDKLEMTLPYSVKEADHVVVVTESNDKATQELCKKHGAVAVLSDRKTFDGAIFNKGALLNDGINFALKEYGSKWIVLTDSDIIFPSGIRSGIVGKIYNPGTLYFAERICVEKENVKKFLNEPINMIRYRQEDAHSNMKAWGYFQLFNTESSWLKGRAPKYYSEEYLSAGYVDKEFLQLWPKERRFFTGLRLIHINHGERGKNWHGERD